MSNNYYETQLGAEIKNILRNLATAWDAYARMRNVMIEQKDTAASGNAVYAYHASHYGYVGVDAAAQQAVAAASFSEIDSAFGNGNASITQMLSRHL